MTPEAHERDLRALEQDIPDPDVRPRVVPCNVRSVTAGSAGDGAMTPAEVDEYRRRLRELADERKRLIGEGR